MELSFICCIASLIPDKIYMHLIFLFATGADQSRIMQEQMSGAAMAMPADTNKAFKVS